MAFLLLLTALSADPAEVETVLPAIPKSVERAAERKTQAYLRKRFKRRIPPSSYAYKKFYDGYLEHEMKKYLQRQKRRGRFVKTPLDFDSVLEDFVRKMIEKRRERLDRLSKKK